MWCHWPCSVYSSTLLLSWNRWKWDRFWIESLIPQLGFQVGYFLPTLGLHFGVCEQHLGVTLVAGWTMFTLIVGLIPGVAIWTLLTRKSRRWRKVQKHPKLFYCCPPNGIGRTFNNFRGTLQKFLASIRPNSQWGPKDATEKSLWIDYRRSLYPTTKLFRMTIGRFVKVRRTPIMLAAMTSPMSLDINSVSTVGDGSSIIAMSAVKRDSRSGEVKPDAAAAAVASE